MLVQRAHLLKLLDDGGLPRLLLIHAPPGYGKTTLAQQIARHRDACAVWHTVTTWQRDLNLLVAASHQAWTEAVPKLASALAEVDESPQRAARQLTDALATLPVSADKPYFYIIDDVHHLSESPKAGRWLQTLIDTCPAHVHILLVGRQIPQLSYVDLMGRGLVKAIHQELLRFTVTEAQSLGQLSPDAAQQLVERFDGWVAGIRLAVDPLAKGLTDLLPDTGAPGEALFHAFAERLFDDQPVPRQQFLLDTATLKQFTPETCRNILQLPDASMHIAALQQHNLFLIQQDGTYRYHDLFRRFLQERLRQQNPQRQLHLQYITALWYEEDDQILEAIDHYLEADLPEEAIRLAENSAAAFYVQGQWETVLMLTRRLQAQPVPRLKLICAMIQTERNDIAASDRLLEDVQHHFQQRGDERGMMRATLQGAHNAERRGEYRRALAQCDHILTDRQPDTPLQLWAWSIKGHAFIGLGQYDAAIAALQKALVFCDELGDTLGRSKLLQDLHSAYLLSGDYDRAGACLHEVIAIRRRIGNPAELALALNNLGFFYHVHAQYQDALTTLHDGLALPIDTDSRTYGYLQWSLGDVLRDLGDADAAMAAYNRALRIAQAADDTLYQSVLLSQAHLLIWQAHDLAAQRWLVAALRAAHEDDMLHHVARALLIAARWLHTGTTSQEEHHQLRDVLATLHAGNAQNYLAQVIGVCWYAAYRCRATHLGTLLAGYIAELPDHLQQPLVAQLVNVPGFRAAFAETVGITPALQAGIDALQAAQAARRPMTVSVALVQEPVKLQLLTLGADRVLRNGKPLPKTAWTVKLARELFYYLAFHGPKTKEQIGLLFWPDHDPAQLRTSLHDTLKRVRGALPDSISYIDEAYQINPDWQIQCDAHDLREWVQRAQYLPPANVRAEDLFQRALHTYRGDFLPTMQSEWIDAERDDLRAIYIDALVGAGACAESRDDYRQAVGYYRAALKLEPYDEAIYRLIMLAHFHMGQQHALHTTYTELSDKLAYELATAPAGMTQRLYQRLLRQ